MKTKLKFILIFLVIFSCKEKQEEITDSYISKDVSKFLHALPSLNHNDMNFAFKQLNEIMQYNVEIPSTEGTLQASLEIEKGKLVSKREVILLASPLLPHSDKNEYGISLIVIPPPENDTIIKITESLLTKFKRNDINNVPTWEVNGWLLQVKGNNTISFRAKSNKSLNDLTIQ